jgi:hypothetical protein
MITMAETTFNFVTDETLADKMDNQLKILGGIMEALGGNMTPKNWLDVQSYVRMGLAKKLFSVGQIFETTYGDYTSRWRVLDFDRDAENSMTIEMLDVVPSVQFDSAEAMYYADKILSAGTYTFKCYNVSYQFTTTVDIPAGGVICLTTFSGNVPTTAISYNSRQSTTALETITVSAGSDGTDLGTCDGTTLNHIDRIRYGSNNYKESAIRQWLNSSAAKGSVWTPQTKWDRPPSWATTLAGFQSLLDPDLVTIAMPVTKKVNRNTVNEGGGYDEVKDKFWLLSEREVFGTGSGTALEGDEAYAYYQDFSDFTSANSNADKNRIKYSIQNRTQTQYWWLRSPVVSSSSYVRCMNTAGNVNYGNAYNAHAAAPACCIY